MEDPWRRLIESSPRIVGGGAGRELSGSGAATILGHDDPAMLEHALLDFWSDLHARVDLQPRLVLSGFLRSSQVWARIPPVGHVDRHALAALDQMALALCPATRSRDIGELVPPPAITHLQEALLHHVEHLTASPTALPAVELHWVTLANSIVSMWPELLARAMAPIVQSAVRTWRSTLRFIATIAYTTEDSPLVDKPFFTWDRFGAPDGVCWPSEAVSKLGTLLAAPRVSTMLRDIATRVTSSEPREIEYVTTLCEEILEVQLELDFARRREILLDKLLMKGEAQYWDDEAGMSAG